MAEGENSLQNNNYKQQQFFLIWNSNVLLNLDKYYKGF